MAKVIDITDKLNFEEKPKLIIKGVEIEVNNKAVDVLRITPILTKETVAVDSIYTLYQTLFSEESQQKVEALELDIKDFTAMIFAAAELISSNDGGEGEAEPRTTT